jgi:hypothetical protein
VNKGVIANLPEIEKVIEEIILTPGSTYIGVGRLHIFRAFCYNTIVYI